MQNLKHSTYPYEEEEVLKNGCSAFVLYPSNQSGGYKELQK